MNPDDYAPSAKEIELHAHCPWQQARGVEGSCIRDNQMDHNHKNFAYDWSLDYLYWGFWLVEAAHGGPDWNQLKLGRNMICKDLQIYAEICKDLQIYEGDLQRSFDTTTKLCGCTG